MALNQPSADDFITELAAARTARTRMYGSSKDGDLPLPADVDVPCWGPTYAQVNQVRALYDALVALMVDSTCDDCGSTALSAASWTGSRDNDDEISGQVGMQHLDPAASGTWATGSGGVGGRLGICDIVIAEHISELATVRGTMTWYIDIDPAESYVASPTECDASCPGTSGLVCNTQTNWAAKTAWMCDSTAGQKVDATGGAVEVGFIQNLTCCEFQEVGSLNWYHELCGHIDEWGPGCNGAWQQLFEACVEVLKARTVGYDYDAIVVCENPGQVHSPGVGASANGWTVEWTCSHGMAASEDDDVCGLFGLCDAGACALWDGCHEGGAPGEDYVEGSRTMCDISDGDKEEVCTAMIGHIKATA